jgi:hypothetical protein
MDKAAIFTSLLRRNALRREARLPPIDVRAEYQKEVEDAFRREVHDHHHDIVRAEVVERLREERGPGWDCRGGGRWLIDALTQRELHRRFPLPKRLSPK